LRLAFAVPDNLCGHISAVALQNVLTTSYKCIANVV